MMIVSIIVPVYNEKETIFKILEKLRKTRINNLQKEIIVIDDGSTDGSTEILNDLRNKFNHFKLIKHKKNLGKGSAIRSGFKIAIGDVAIIQDADLEYNPEEIEKLVKPILSREAKVVYGSRFANFKFKISGKNKTPFISHYLGNKLLVFMTNLLFKSKITDMETGYKIFSKEIYKSLIISSSGFEFEAEVTAKLLAKGIFIKEVPISFSPRSYKQGKKITWIDGIGALKTLLYYKLSLSAR